MTTYGKSWIPTARPLAQQAHQSSELIPSFLVPEVTFEVKQKPLAIGIWQWKINNSYIYMYVYI
jgi:hypothetical protein